MQSKAVTVAQYLDSLPPERRDAIEAVRRVIVDNIDGDIEEGMQYGMLGYYVPHRVFPQGYHCDPAQPVPFAALASQKHYMSLYLMFAYSDGDGERLIREGFEKAGKKLDMGKSCIRFKRLEDLELGVIGDVIRATTGAKLIARYVESVGPNAWKGKKAKPSA
jgi:hypothetical protein